jgi:hypothetical protein
LGICLSIQGKPLFRGAERRQIFGKASFRKIFIAQENRHGSPYQPGGSNEGALLTENGREFNPARPN